MDKNLYFTQSLNIAAWLMSKNIKFMCKTAEAGVTTFYFERTPETKLAIDEYNSNQELKGFISAFKDIRNILRDN